MSKNLLNFLIIVASLSMYYLVISPLYTGAGSVWQPSMGVAASRNLSSQYDSTLLQIENLSSRANILHGQYKNISPETKQKMEVMVPDKVDPVRLISEVNTIANQAGSVIHDLSYSENVSSSDVRGSYIVSFSVTTSYSNFKKLMLNYETSLRLFTIKSVGFSSPLKEGDYTTFQVKLETSYMK